ncbi:cytochrome P450 [Scleroderma citrinum]
MITGLISDPYIISSTVLVLTAVFAAWKHSELDAIPTVGSTTWLGSYFSAVKNLSGVSGLVQEGYDKHKNALFKIPTLYTWIIVASGDKFLDEIRKVPEDHLSAVIAGEDVFKFRFTVGPKITKNMYHATLIRTGLNRKLAALFPVVNTEIVLACDEMFSFVDDEWKSIMAIETIQQIILRGATRVFVGLPLCRNSAWLKFCSEYATEAFVAGAKINLFPEFMWPLIAIFVTKKNSLTRRAMEYLRPLIRERREKWFQNTHTENQADRPEDFLQWLVNDGRETSEWDITQRTMALVFPGLDTISTSLLQALYFLAAYPEYLKPLREEVEALVHEDGWSKSTIDKMYKMDSFMKESHRIGSNIVSLVMMRKVLKDFTFSDGRVVPKGFYIAAPGNAVHHDERIYDSPNTFDPFRFARLRGQGQDGVKQRVDSSNAQYLVFGLGKHACPGRFFVSMLQKTTLARIVMSYDVKLESGAALESFKRDEGGLFMMVDPTTKILFRKRTQV